MLHCVGISALRSRLAEWMRGFGSRHFRSELMRFATDESIAKQSQREDRTCYDDLLYEGNSDKNARFRPAPIKDRKQAYECRDDQNR